MSNKRSRGKNFIDEEVMFLLECIEKKKKIVENKKIDAASNDLKSAAWTVIQNQFNKMFPLNPRSAESLMVKYDNVKQQAKRYAAKQRQGEFLEVNIILEKTLEIINSKSDDVDNTEYDDTTSSSLHSSYVNPMFEEHTSEDKCLEYNPTIKIKEEIGTETSNDIRDATIQHTTVQHATVEHPTPIEPQKIIHQEEGDAFLANTLQDQSARFLLSKERYYYAKMKYLEADIALKRQELKERREQEHLKIELLKLQVEEQKLLVLDKKRKLGMLD